MPGIDLAILGFPKCGTSALFRELALLPQVSSVRAASGSMEVSLSELDRVFDCQHREFLVYKYAAGIYSQKYIEIIYQARPSTKFVLCHRNPIKSLVSWHNMHRNIARKQEPLSHFAARESDFYSNCSVLEYYEKFAKPMLRYDKHFERLARLVPGESIICISQHALAARTVEVASTVLSAVVGESVKEVQEGSPHTAYADSVMEDISEGITDELDASYSRLLRSIEDGGYLSIML